MNNFTLSFELISFLKWLLEDKQEEFTKLIHEAVKKGYLKPETDFLINQDIAHEIINDFIQYSEKTLKESFGKNDLLEVALREQLSEISQHLNLAVFDDTAITKGFKQAKQQIQSRKISVCDYAENQALFRSLLISQILANWQPSKRAAEG